MPRPTPTQKKIAKALQMLRKSANAIADAHAEATVARDPSCDLLRLSRHIHEGVFGMLLYADRLTVGPPPPKS